MQAPALTAFELGQEAESVRTQFGTTQFGLGCLTALRLAQEDVRYTEVTLDGWDTHKDNFTRTAQLMHTLDAGMATLLEQLSLRTARGESRPLLESTLVVLAGDFGRSPRINSDDGRDHHPGAFSAVLAGAGIRAGQVYGATDSAGDKVVQGAVTVPNFMATIAAASGIAHGAMFMTPAGRPISPVDHGIPVAGLLA
jgi:uncharacterized protein (DUF1501 family)